MSPINYKKYPPNWKSEIRPRILKRANNCCEFCKAENYSFAFRGYIETDKNEKVEVYQTQDAKVFDASNGEFLFQDHFCYISPKSGNDNQQAIKIILTIAHLDHDEENWEVKDERLKAMCQRCHLNYDAPEKLRRRKAKENINNFKLDL